MPFDQLTPAAPSAGGAVIASPPRPAPRLSPGARVAAWWLLGFAAFAAFVIANTDLPTFLRYLVLGLPQGAVIALIAVGYSMVYGIIRLINFAHGEVFMFSAYFVLMLTTVPSSPNSATVIGASVFTGLCVGCAAWVAAGERLRGAAGRGALAAVAGLAAAWANHRLMPVAGGTAVLPFVAAWALALVYACCLGVTMDLVAYRPLRDSPRLIPLITAIGVSIFLQNYAQALFGSNARAFPAPARAEAPAAVRAAAAGAAPAALVSAPRIVLWQPAAATPGKPAPPPIGTSRLDLLILALAVGLLAALQGFIHRTRTGRAMRACAQDRPTAALMGIKVDRVVALAFAIGAGLAAVVAPLYVLRGSPVAPQMGYIVGILAFSSAVLGGIGNITGAMLGGLVIGLVYSFVPLFDSMDTFAGFRALEARGWVTTTGLRSFLNGVGKPGQYQLGVAYAFMIVVIVLRPQGLLGKASARRA